jgi:hypothetical protein
MWFGAIFVMTDNLMHDLETEHPFKPSKINGIMASLALWVL